MRPEDIVLIVFGSIFILVAITGIILYTISWNDKRRSNQPSELLIKKQQLEIDDATNKIDKFQVEFSKTYLEYTQYICGQVSVIEFRAFRDQYDVSKATKAQIVELIDSIARKVKDAMQMEKIDFNHLKFTQRYLEELIVNTCVINVKNMLDNEINNMEL